VLEISRSRKRIFCSAGFRSKTFLTAVVAHLHTTKSGLDSHLFSGGRVSYVECLRRFDGKPGGFCGSNLFGVGCARKSDSVSFFFENERLQRRQCRLCCGILRLRGQSSVCGLFANVGLSHIHSPKLVQTRLGRIAKSDPSSWLVVAHLAPRFRETAFKLHDR
jgi:hypothetical protein